MEDKIDIKYIGVPNICFSLTSKDDEREVEYAEDRKKYGFDDSETWSLTDTITNFILPRLERFFEAKNGYPASMSSEKEWDDILNKMVDAFKIISNDSAWLFSEEDDQKVEEGLDLFRKHFFSLWW